MGILFFTVWMVVYAVPVSSSRTFSWIPMEARSSWIVGVMFTCGGVVRFTNSTFLHTEASQIPSPLESYFDCFISFFAAFTSPAWFADGYGSYPEGNCGRTVGGMMCVAMSPCSGPPHAFCRAALLMTKFTAF